MIGFNGNDFISNMMRSIYVQNTLMIYNALFKSKVGMIYALLIYDYNYTYRSKHVVSFSNQSLCTLDTYIISIITVMYFNVT